MLSEASRKITFAYLSVPSFFRVTPFNWDRKGLKISAKTGKTLKAFHLVAAALFFLLEIHYVLKLKHIGRTTAGTALECGFKEAELRCEKFYANVGWLVIYLNNVIWNIGVLLKNLQYKTETASYLNELPRVQKEILAKAGSTKV